MVVGILPPHALNLLTSKLWLRLVKPREVVAPRANLRCSPAAIIAG